MSEFGRSVLAYPRDPSVSGHALSPRAAWLCSVDAGRMLWANPIGAALFGASNFGALIGHAINPNGTAGRQVARLLGTLRKAERRGLSCGALAARQGVR